MIVSTKGSIWGLLQWQWRKALYYVLAALSLAVAAEEFSLTWLTLPGLPLAVTGAAIGIFVSFRTNSAYDRWWEGRKLWGRLINTSRHFASQLRGYLPRAGETADATERQLVLRHLGYVNVLRCLLRRQPPKEDAAVMKYLGAVGSEGVLEGSNPTHALISEQLSALAKLQNDGILDGLKLQSLEQSLRELLDIQGGCERIKNTPMPRGYGFIAERLVHYYGWLFPLGVVQDLGYATVPINLLVCLSFALISEVGRVLEDPFTLFYNTLPLTALSRTIEANLVDSIGTEPQVTIPQPNEHGILY